MKQNARCDASTPIQMCVDAEALRVPEERVVRLVHLRMSKALRGTGLAR